MTEEHHKGKQGVRLAEWFVLAACAVNAGVNIYLSSYQERARPVTAEQVLRRENLLNAKREVYEDAVAVFTRTLLANSDEASHAEDSAKLTDYDLNLVRARLLLSADSLSVVFKFDSFLDWDVPVPTADTDSVMVHYLADFIALARSDLGGTPLIGAHKLKSLYAH